MQTALYLDDMYLQEFDSKIVSVSDGKYVILEQTAFYPKSGGVEGDTGVLVRKSDNKEFSVVYTGKFGGNISHEVSAEGLQVGDEVHGRINWVRRYELMRYHTAAHLLSGVFWNENRVKITGNNLSPGKGRIDFSLVEFDRTLIEQLVEKANEIIKEDLHIKTYQISRKELEADPSLTKLAMGLPEKIQEVRIVEIDGYDKQPDGGCHVHQLSEIGKISIENLKNKGKSKRRLYYSLG